MGSGSELATTWHCNRQCIYSEHLHLPSASAYISATHLALAPTTTTHDSTPTRRFHLPFFLLLGRPLLKQLHMTCGSGQRRSGEEMEMRISPRFRARARQRHQPPGRLEVL
jgi:hypothetical protein